jgi:hypothetical protein
MSSLLQATLAKRSQAPARGCGAGDRPRRHAPVRSHPRPEGGRPTLEQTLQSVWEGLHADGAAECPACYARMELAGAAGACGDCGSELA